MTPSTLCLPTDSLYMLAQKTSASHSFLQCFDTVWLGHFTRKNLSPICPIMCWWDVKPYSTHLLGLQKGYQSLNVCFGAEFFVAEEGGR